MNKKTVWDLKAKCVNLKDVKTRYSVLPTSKNNKFTNLPIWIINT